MLAEEISELLYNYYLISFEHKHGTTMIKTRNWDLFGGCRSTGI
jgi:hypothetical protein